MVTGIDFPARFSACEFCTWTDPASEISIQSTDKYTIIIIYKAGYRKTRLALYISFPCRVQIKTTFSWNISYCVKFCTNTSHELYTVYTDADKENCPKRIQTRKSQTLRILNQRVLTKHDPTGRWRFPFFS